MNERKYAVKCNSKSTGGETKERGWAEGYSRARTAKFIGECFAEGGKVGKITFNHREVTPKHHDALIQLAKLWTEIADMEKSLKPGDASRARSS